MNPTLDTLSRAPAETSRPVRRIPAWLVPLGLLASFALLFLALFRDRLLPATPVETALVLATAGGEESSSTPSSEPGGMLFQASGWIEPDPLPIRATALIDGVVDVVHVLEGQSVKKGEPLATLVDADARLALAASESRHRMFVSGRASHLVAIDAARKKLENLEAMRAAAVSMEEEADDRHARIKDLKNAVSAAEIVATRLALDRAKSGYLAAEATAAEASSEVKRLELETQTKDDEIAAAMVEVDQAKLALSRTRIVSPVDGRVLRLNAAPGQKKMLLMDDPDSSTIAILYQPDRLQVRVDVPLADAARLSVGQAAKVRCSLLPEKVFAGEVTRITGEADVQRNTLQAKVRIIDPIDQLRPEMLCRVEFLGSASTIPGQSVGGILAIWVPESAVVDGTAWVCDPESKRVEKRAIQTSAETREGRLRIIDGLRLGEHVVLSPKNLREGQRVNPTQP
ncbi:efflux RND transporter periplasmic adaptor subunit [Luteolibacter flavescens]|uniref:Efflux RND transporter periplasmic adaptor subunit n=1 Tax=Luteolibacter flavescens TaxID=1859460 RepID=A0ABT3FT46_9BACT|nr:efflux RND transporter periplasmic adaptor subunit [Luteolibacter flavescens]MCW1886756.1 efflux RND transporter periplasmic adaptor subunit [Luteolibacter flavescens]